MNFFSEPEFFKLFISPYQLQRTVGPPLKGALLAFDFGFGEGYSDFLPWPSFKEPSLSEELKQMRKGQFSPRFLIARHNAFLDAQARSQKRSLFFGLKIPKSHFLIEDPLPHSSEFAEKPTMPFSSRESGNPEVSLSRELNLELPHPTHIKNKEQIIKVKLQPHKRNEQIQYLKKWDQKIPGLKWRLDLNGESWRKWKSHLIFLKSRIDFIEDPLPEKNLFNSSDRSLFAEDWLSLPSSQIKIVKPSRDRMDLLIKNLALCRWKRVIFTHSMDHPLGQAISAFWAGQFYKLYPRFFETGAFVFSGFKQVKNYPWKNSENFMPPSGFGFGFSNSLKKEPWRRWL